MKKQIFILIALMASHTGMAYAIPIVSYSSTGTSGNYVLDFTVENTIDPSYGQSLYFFGVDLADANLDSPTGWSDWRNGGTWNNTSFGGSTTNYESTWITSSTGPYAIDSGESLSGFTISSAVLPDVVNFYAFGVGGNYTQSAAFYTGWNPGFEGEVDDPVNTVPEPASLALLFVGLAGLGFSRRIKIQ